MTRRGPRIGQLEQLYRLESAALVRALTVAIADRQAAEELVQEVFVQAFRHWSSISAYDDPAAWLRRVAAGRAANYRRDRARRDDVVGRLRSITPSTHEDPDRADNDVLAALLALPEGQRLVVSLFYLLDRPSAEIAGALGISDGTVRSQLHAARQSLGRLLVEKAEVEQ